MKPVFKTRAIITTYWDCGNKDCNHRTERVAQDCMTKRAEVLARNHTGIRWTDDNLIELLTAHQSGIIQRDLSRKLSLSPERVRQLLRKASRISSTEIAYNDEFGSLNPRARNCLHSAGIRTVADARAAMSSGALDNIPNFGARSKSEVMALLAGSHRK